MTANSDTIQIRVTQEYLEMARAVSSVKGNRQVTDASEQDKDVTDLCRRTQFAFLSASVIYSHLAVEAFTNWQLCTIWKRKFGVFPSRQTLKQEGLDDLRSRIKKVCRDLGIRPLHESDGRLWQQFVSLVKQRNFLVHPSPDPGVFQRMMDQLLSQKPTYPEVASRVIAYLYTETNTPKPCWLKKSELFETLTTDLLF